VANSGTVCVKLGLHIERDRHLNEPRSRRQIVTNTTAYDLPSAVIAANPFTRMPKTPTGNPCLRQSNSRQRRAAPWHLVSQGRNEIPTRLHLSAPILSHHAHGIYFPNAEYPRGIFGGNALRLHRFVPHFEQRIRFATSSSRASHYSPFVRAVRTSMSSPGTGE
jgi:hypothetical protein